MTRAPHRDFELQSSELWGSKIDLSAQLQIQSMGFETKSVPFFRLHYLFFFSIFWGLILPRNNRESRAKNGLGVQAIYVHVTGHDRQKRALGFPVRHNASQNISLQNAFAIFECQMERRYKIQCTPFYYKNCCTGPSFLLEFSTTQGMVSSTCSPFSSGNGKGDYIYIYIKSVGIGNHQPEVDSHNDISSKHNLSELMINPKPENICI